MVHRLVSVGTVKGWQTDALIRSADLPPGFCLKNIGMKLSKKSGAHAGRHAAPRARARSGPDE
nr:hypothetical protein [Burkholderia ambifaria]